MVRVAELMREDQHLGRGAAPKLTRAGAGGGLALRCCGSVMCRGQRTVKG